MIRIMSIAMAVALALSVLVSGVATALMAPAAPRPAPAAALSAPKTLTDTAISGATEAAAATAGPSVVKIEHAGGLGSGVIVDTRGYIITNYHVLFGASAQQPTDSRYTVTLADGRAFQANIVGADAPDDLAMLKISASGLKALPMANSAALRSGQFVLAVGNPLGYSQTVTFGIVSTPQRTVAENGPAFFIPDMIQTSAPINPGNSGGALVDLAGRLVGIPTLAAADPRLGTAAQGIGFAIPSNRVSFIAEQLIAEGKVTHSDRPYLGIENIRELSPTLAARYGLTIQGGILIGAVEADGPAARAGLRAGEVIVRLNGHVTANATALGEALAPLKPGQKAQVTLVGENGERTLSMTLGELPVR